MQQTDATDPVSCYFTPGVDHLVYVLLGVVQFVRFPISQRGQATWRTVTAEILDGASPFSIVLLLGGCPVSQSLVTNPNDATQPPPKP
jgi:hypothetical protein